MRLGLGLGLHRPALRRGAGTVPAYTANPVTFDGTNDWLSRGAGLTDAVDTTKVTFSVWLRFTSAAALNIVHLGPASSQEGWRLVMNAGGVNVTGRNTANATVLSFTPGVAINDGAWHHLMGSVDLTSAALRHYYIDGVSIAGTYSTYNTAAQFDLTRTDHFVGSRDAGSTKYPGDMADLQIWIDKYIDLAVAGNRALFLANGKPVAPGVAAASALGVPIIRLSGATVDWHTNKGTGGGFTENGALTDGTGPVEL